MVLILANWPENSAEIIYHISWVEYLPEFGIGKYEAGFEDDRI